MTLTKFPGHNIVFAENQPEYLPLPAYKFPHDPTGQIVCCWKLTWRERIRILFGGVIWHSILTFNQPLQPQLLQADKPKMGV